MGACSAAQPAQLRRRFPQGLRDNGLRSAHTQGTCLALAAGVRVVVAEDDVQACLALSSLLRDEGHVVSEAFDGQQALRLVLTEAPDAVVTDHLMPGLDGLSLIRLARQAGSEAFFILITGTAPDDAWKVADHVLGKPVNLDRLFEVLARVPRGTADG